MTMFLQMQPLVPSAKTLLVALLFFHSTSATEFSTALSQTLFELSSDQDQESQWRVSLSHDWDVLGPFPIYAREQHFLSPGFPLNLTSPYHHEQVRAWPSSLSESTEATWRKVHSDAQGNLIVSFPDVRWSKIRATEGWAGLQHHTVLHTSLIVQPLPSRKSEVPGPRPRIRVQLTQGSFFSILSRETVGLHPEWHPGNIYAMSRAPSNSVELPGIVNTGKSTIFDFFVSGDYEIRLFGDPQDNGKETPELRISVTVNAEKKQNIVERQESHDVICDFVDGFSFGDALGIGLRSVDGWWTVKDIKSPEEFPTSVSLSIYHKELIAPSQARIVPIKIKQTGRFDGKSISFDIILQEQSEHGGESQPKITSVPVTLPIHQLPLWNSTNWDAIRATFFFASSHPTYFLVKPPKAPSPDGHSVPILALHGAGVDVISAPFWANAIPRQENSWIIMPVGRTGWGLDWHGPSASEAWAALPVLRAILIRKKEWSAWSFSPDSRALILGHSNGGQGAWYLASRFPDRVHALVAAAGFLSASAYVPLTQSRGSRFVDPALRSVLESSFVPDDNALFVGNLANNIRILAVHGGNDTNVPTWHSREYVSIIKSWGSGYNVSYHVDEGQPHWYDKVFESEQVRLFFANALDSEGQKHSSPDKILEFTFTVADTVRSGSLNGFKIDAVVTPGRLARLHVRLKEGATLIKTVNVRRFSIVPGSRWLHGPIVVDGTHLPRYPEDTREGRSFLSEYGLWHEAEATASFSVPPGRVQNIFDTLGPLTIIIPSDSSSMLSTALRIAHALDVYLNLDSEILLDDNAVHFLQANSEELEITRQGLRGNLFILGGKENSLSRKLLKVSKSDRQTGFGLSESGQWLFRDKPLRQDDDLGILFTHPHPINPSGSAIFLSSSSETNNTISEGLERVLRLIFPRTGIAVPDWIIVGKEVDELSAGGVSGAGVWDSTWKWNEVMSYMT